MPPDPITRRPGCNRPARVGRRGQANEQQAKRKHLRGHVSAGGIDELRQEREKEQRRVRIQHIDDDALGEHAAESRTLDGDVGHRRRSPGQRLNAEKSIAKADLACHECPIVLVIPDIPG